MDYRINNLLKFEKIRYATKGNASWFHTAWQLIIMHLDDNIQVNVGLFTPPLFYFILLFLKCSILYI